MPQGDGNRGVRLGVDGQGYYTVHGPDGERAHVHRLVALTDYPPDEVVRSDVHHIDGTRCNNGRENLMLKEPYVHRKMNLTQNRRDA